MSRRWRAVILLGAAGIGCAYFNGLYNANQLAGDAVRAEREGRPGEARSLWAQVAVKAESVATRYPRSRHRDDALLLWGRGLFEIGECGRAVGPLSLASTSSPDSAVQRRSRLLLAQCELALDRPADAIATLDAVLEGADSASAAHAFLLRGRAELARGNPTGAVRDLQRAPPGLATIDLAHALLRLEDVASARAALEAHLSLPYREGPWLAVLDSLALRDREGTAALVGRVAERGHLTAGQRTRLLNADGIRWKRAGDVARARDQFRSAAALAPDSADADLARAYAGVASFELLEDLAALEDVRRALDRPVRAGGRPAQIAGATVGVLDLAIQVVGSRELPRRDVKLFVIGEMVRDSLRAPLPASAFFLLLQREHPTSPVAPKALLAAATLRPDLADSVSRMLDGRYPDSPYRLALVGEASERFASLEDSLAAVFAAERQHLRDAQGGSNDREGLLER